ncbi:MAG: hypothetical protein ABJG68_07685 [Crocinitomicaceae bacterium]
MKLAFLNSAYKRAGFSFGLTALLVVVSWFIEGYDLFSLYFVVLGTVVVYIPVTLFYAIVSTFCTKDEKEESSEILDD